MRQNADIVKGQLKCPSWIIYKSDHLQEDIRRRNCVSSEDTNAHFGKELQIWTMNGNFRSKAQYVLHIMNISHILVKPLIWMFNLQ